MKLRSSRVIAIASPTLGAGISRAFLLAVMLLCSTSAVQAQWNRGARYYSGAVPQTALVSSMANAERGGGPADDGGCSERSGKSIAGSWLLTPVGPDGMSFKALATFTTDGNVIFATQGEATAQPLFTAEHGVWGCLGDRFTFTTLEINYNQDGSLAGIFKVRANVSLNPAGDEVSEGRFVFEFTDPSGGLIASGHGTVSGKRIKLEPLH